MPVFAATSSLSTARALAAVFQWNGRAYALGGCTGAVVDANAIATTESALINADGTLGTWGGNTSLIAARRSMAVAVHSSGRVYVIGGNNTAGTVLQTVDHSLIDPSTGVLGAWTNTLNLTGARAHAAAFFVGNVLYVMGGASSVSTLQSTVFRATINPATGAIGAWTTGATSLPLVQRGHFAFQAGSKVFNLGGQADTAGLHSSRAHFGDTGGGADITWADTIRQPCAFFSTSVVRGSICVDTGKVFILQAGVLMEADVADSGLSNWKIRNVSLPTDLIGNGGVFSGSKIYHIGGVLIPSTGVVVNTAVANCYYNTTPLHEESNTPTITNISPASGGELGRFTRLSFSAVDLSPGVRFVGVWMKYAKHLHYTMVYDGGAFLDPFATESTVGTSGGGTQVDFSVLPAGGWVDRVERVRIRVIDQNGNIDVEI